MNFLNWNGKKEAAKHEAQQEKPLSIFQHPFEKGSLSHIEMRIGRPFAGSNGEIAFTADVHFRNTGSNGWHTIKGDSLQNLVDKINIFLGAL